MVQKITLNQLQGLYEVTYASSPPVEGFFEPGFGSAQIEGNKLSGVDALGVIWSAELDFRPDGNLTFNAVLDPTETPVTVGLMDKRGNMTREPQHYSGIIKVIKTDNYLLLRTKIQQGPITINVQFRRK